MTPVALQVPLDGMRLIEASAGTGKTWTLSGLYLRLVAQQGLSADQILVLTFTKAATAELRDRIVSRLRQMLDLLESRGDGDEFCAQLLLQLPDPTLARRRLQSALSSVDDAAIYTIHGFCQRVLGDRAFSSGVAFENEIAQDPMELRREIVLDFWRRRIAFDDPARSESGDLFIGWLQQHGVTPGDLVRWVTGLIGKPDLQIIDAVALSPIEDPCQRYLGLRQRAALAWQQHREEISRRLMEHKGLNRNSYNQQHLPKRFAEVDAWLAAGALLEMPKHVSGFRASRLAEKNKGEAITEEWFVTLDELFDAGVALDRAFEAHWRALRLELLAYARQQLPQRLREQRLLSYDDLLSELDASLSADDGEVLASELRRRYPATLIDEFQDTDPLQWRIVKRIYADGLQSGEPLIAFLVGDPKQSIYSFRGADIFSYLTAKSACTARHELTENQRSVPGYIDALNVLYEGVASPFLHSDIRYQRVVASPRPKPLLEDRGQADPAPLRLWLMPGSEFVAKTHGEAWAAHSTAAEIASLLADADAGNLTYGARALQAGDIAVLVNNHYQASAVRVEMAHRGIACAVQSTDSVFDSDEGEQLERLLLAVSVPHRGATLKAALLSELIGMTVQQVQDAESTEREWERILTQFERYHELWRDRGFMRMFRELVREQGIAGRLAAETGGERRLTNLFHLAELMNAQQAREQGVESLLAWLRSQRGSKAIEDTQLRLESDAALVQIVTIHASKGLEYPVVFLPFLWNAKTFFEDTDDLVVHHETSPPYRLQIDGGARDPSSALRLARHEELAERLRLTYVALTRAKNRCYLFSGPFKELSVSPLGVLLHGLGDRSATVSDITVAQVTDTVDNLVARSNGTIRRVLEDRPSVGPGAPATGGSEWALTARALDQRPPSGFVVTSYTRLLQDAAERIAFKVHDEVLPDHDQRAVAQLAATVIPGGGRFAFPRGAAAGTCLHAMFENIRADDQPATWRSTVSSQLRLAGFPVDWTTEVTHWIAQIVRTPMTCPATSRTLRLSTVPTNRTIPELAFHLPLPGVRPAKIADLADAHGVPVSSLSSRRVQGYVRGFIDLTFEQEGRWYIADYKSNWLGAQAQDYQRPALERVMADGDYHLQYLLYTLAVHRWLGWRIPGYDYDRHFGGVFYLFLRGMGIPEEGANESGVYSSRPDRVLIDELDCLFREEVGG